MSDRPWGFRTRALHAGAIPDATTGARAVPIFQTTSFVFEDGADAADLFALQKYGNIYTRLGNPTTAVLEERLASLEGGIGCVAFASGQAAEFAAITALARAGDHVVASASLYGGTYTLLDVTLRELGIETTFVAGDSPSAFAAAVIPGKTKLLYTETIGNPTGVVADVSALSKVAHDAGIVLVVDNTLATPFLCRPIEHGADVVIHSVTKFLGGHGTSLGGAVIDSGTVNWGNGNYPHFTKPVASYGGLQWWENFGEYAFCTKLRNQQLRDGGACLSPFNAFLLLQGIDTLPLRMASHVENAMDVASFLARHPSIDWVRYPGMHGTLGESEYDKVNHYLPDGAGAVFTFGVAGGRAGAAKFIESLTLCSHLANIGDARTLVIHPSSTTHRQLSEEALLAGGVAPEMVRISVGLEDLDDICWDIDQALDVSQTALAAEARRADDILTNDTDDKDSNDNPDNTIKGASQ
jgi:O-acetylhomoserine (thiol)-lyase